MDCGGPLNCRGTAVDRRAFLTPVFASTAALPPSTTRRYHSRVLSARVPVPFREIGTLARFVCELANVVITRSVRDVEVTAPPERGRGASARVRRAARSVSLLDPAAVVL